MPYRWDADSERKMLILVIDKMESNPSKDTFERVAAVLGGGLNSNAVSQKFYKLKKESEKITAGDGHGEASTSTQTTPARTPRKRKVKTEPETNGETPTKKGRKKGVKAEPTDDLEVSEKVKQEDDVTEPGDDDQLGGEQDLTV